jgi:hypothetical protein
VATGQPVADADLLWTSGVTYAVDQSGALRWRTATSGPPATSLEGTDTLARSQITAVTGTAVVTLSGTSGRVLQRFPVSARGASGAWPYGTGFVVAGAGTRGYR